MNPTLRVLLFRMIGDMPQHSEGMFRGHYVERVIGDYWVDHSGPMQLAAAVTKVGADPAAKPVLTDRDGEMGDQLSW